MRGRERDELRLVEEKGREEGKRKERGRGSYYCSLSNTHTIFRLFCVDSRSFVSSLWQCSWSKKYGKFGHFI